MIPEDRLYTEEHECILVDGDTAVVGITQPAADLLGDITYVELPAAGQQVDAGDVLGSIESVKAVSDIYAPVDGVVAEVNSRLENEPGLINSDPYGEGWVCKITVADRSQLLALLSPAAYAELVEND